MFRKFVGVLVVASGTMWLQNTSSAQNCQPSGTVKTVMPCDQTKQGIITVSSSGEFAVSSSLVSGPPQTWQFRLHTEARGTDPLTGNPFIAASISLDNVTLNCGGTGTYTQVVDYYSPAYPDGTYSSFGDLSARNLTNYGSYAVLSSKTCNYTVDNP